MNFFADKRILLLNNIDKVHTTEMGIDRIRKNLELNHNDVVEYCRNKILDKDCNIYKQGKNWYCEIDNIIITINSYSYTIITAHRIKQQKKKDRNTYSTSEVAKIIGIHPNTVRMYEEWKLIPKAERKANGYRIFTDFHLEQLRLARVAFQMEVLQNGLRKKIVETVKASARGEFDCALCLTEKYRMQLQQEIKNAADAIQVAQRLFSGTAFTEPICMRRKEVSEHLDISMDTLRNWELNGLLSVKRKQNGYRVYTGEDIDRLMIIRALRYSNYSLESILRMLNALERDSQANMEQVLNTPGESADIISVCDRLIVSLQTAEQNAAIMTDMLTDMKRKFLNTTL